MRTPSGSYEPFTVAGDEARNIETRVQGIMDAGKRALEQARPIIREH